MFIRLRILGYYSDFFFPSITPVAVKEFATGYSQEAMNKVLINLLINNSNLAKFAWAIA